MRGRHRMFEFTGLKVFHGDMRLQNETRAIFPITYNNKGFSCIFITDVLPYKLYLTTLGNEPCVFEIEIDKQYRAKTYIENYKDLINYLGIKYDPNHKFKPVDFFVALNCKIPRNFCRKPSYRDTLIVVSKTRKIEDVEKIYFCGWLPHYSGKRMVSPENLVKTRFAFGDVYAELSKDRNISSKWSADENEEALSKINEYLC